MQTLPEVGKTYFPAKFPDAPFKVVGIDAQIRRTTTTNETSFVVSFCDPNDASEEVDFQLSNQEWIEQGFTLYEPR